MVKSGKWSNFVAGQKDEDGQKLVADQKLCVVKNLYLVKICSFSKAVSG